MTVPPPSALTPPARGIRQRFGAGVALNLVGVLFNQGSTLVTNMVLARILGAATFGQYVLVLSTLQALSGFAGLGMGFTATRYLPEFRVRDRERARRVLGLGSVSTGVSGALFALALAAVASIVATRSMEAPHLAPLLRIGAVVIVCTAVNGYLTGVLAGLERYASVARAGVASGSAYVALCTAGASLGGLRGAVLGLAASALAQLLILNHLYRRALAEEALSPTYSGLGAERVIVRRWVVPGLLSGLTAIPALWLVQLFLARQPGGFTELAKYSAAYSLSMIVLFLPNVAYNVGMSLINHARGTGSNTDYRSVFWTNLQFTVGVVVVGALAMGTVGPLLLRGYGSAFDAAFPVLLILLAATIPESLTIAMYQLIQSNDRIWDALKVINIPRDLLIPALAFVLAPSHGAVGVAAAYLAGRVLACITSALLCWRIGLSISPGSAPDLGTASS